MPRFKGNLGKWVFCLAREEAGHVKVCQVSAKTRDTEVYKQFQKELTTPGFFLVKLQAQIAARLLTQDKLIESLS